MLLLDVRAGAGDATRNLQGSIEHGEQFLEVSQIDVQFWWSNLAKSIKILKTILAANA